MAAYDPELWHDFAVAFVGAAAALLGLAFVAISFNLEPILQDERLPRRAIDTLVYFAFTLASGLLMLLPGLSLRAVGVGEAVLALGLAFTIGRTLPRLWSIERHDPLSWRVSHLAPGVIVTLLALVAAIASITGSIGGLYWLAAAMGFATCAGIINSWVLLVEIKR